MDSQGARMTAVLRLEQLAKTWVETVVTPAGIVTDAMPEQAWKQEVPSSRREAGRVSSVKP